MSIPVFRGLVEDAAYNANPHGWSKAGSKVNALP
jgi:hypothetical protein